MNIHEMAHENYLIKRGAMIDETELQRKLGLAKEYMVRVELILDKSDVSKSTIYQALTILREGLSEINPDTWESLRRGFVEHEPDCSEGEWK